MKRLKLSIYYIQELNYRLAYATLGTTLIFFTTYIYKQGLIFLLLPRGLSHFVSSGLTEIFFTYIQLCIILSLSFGIFLVVSQSYIFLRPGMYTYESNTFLRLLISAFCFYVCIYVLIFPTLIKIIWELFLTYSQNFTPINLTFEPRLNNYLDHVQQLNKILIFSFPCLLTLNLFQKYTNKQLWVKHRGIAYIVAFFIAAFITPPDIISQIFVGAPLIFFFEAQIVTWTFYKKYQQQFLVRQPIKPHKNTLRNKK
ncbi:unnamed protein product [Ectocarpus sp. 13 AM-2016]